MYGTGIAALVAFCPNLLRLDLAFCPQLTDESVRAIGLYCPALLQLDLGSCFALSDLSLAYLSNGYATRLLHTLFRCSLGSNRQHLPKCDCTFALTRATVCCVFVWRVCVRACHWMFSAVIV
jgi:hypothetical protein